jgi:hypothetical protein
MASFMKPPLSRLLTSLLLALPAGAAAASYQAVARLHCPDGELVIDARPYNENEAGSSQVDMRYRYRGVELAAIHYEQYYRNLDRYLQQDVSRTRELGLDLDTSGSSKSWRHDRGDTLYLPPAQFTADEADRLAACVKTHQRTLRNTFAQATIRSRFFLGLMKTKSQVPLEGIARIVHADAPLTGIYSAGGWLLVLIERDGRVLLQTNLTANNPGEAVTWGQALPGRRGKPTLRLQRITFRDEIYDTERRFLASVVDRHGRSLRDDYAIEAAAQ